MIMLTIFMFERQLMQMPSPKDIVIYWAGPRAFSVVQKPWGWVHISVQKPRGSGGGGLVTGQIDTCIMFAFGLIAEVLNFGYYSSHFLVHYWSQAWGPWPDMVATSKS